jgi:hypothetical protein
MDALGILALGLLLSVTAVLLKDLGWRGAAVFSAFSLVALLSLCADGLLSLSGAIGDLAARASLSEAARGVLKIAGIGFLSCVTADICRELGEGGAARGVLLAGRIEMLCIALPYLEKIIALGVELLE